MKSKTSIAIVGIGGIFPQAPTPNALWNLVASAANTASEPQPGRWALPVEQAYNPEKGVADKVYSKRACFVDHDDIHLDYSRINIKPELVQQLDPVFQLLLHAGTQAYFDAATISQNPARIGVIAGNLALPTEATARLAQDYLGRTLSEQIVKRPVPASNISPLNRFMTGLPACVLAQALGLGGSCFTLDAACASSLYALKLAVEELQSGRADAMLAGGVARPDPLYTQMGFSQLRALSPSGTCAPFDRNGDGLVVGEGSGMVLLKRLEDALSDGDHIYATIEGIGLSNDIGGSLLAPTSEGQLRAMRSAYEQADWNPRDVELLECHATGTPVGDAVELDSLRQLWEGNAADTPTAPGSCVIGSVKSNVGHLLTAAGSAALIKTLLALKHHTLPPTANFATPGEYLASSEAAFTVLQNPRPWQPRHASGLRRAGVSAFGFGGINAHVLLQEWNPELCADGKEKAGSASAAPDKNAPCPADEDNGIAIVGLDVRSAAATNVEAFWSQATVDADKTSEPEEPVRWGGVAGSRWWKNEQYAPCRGHYLDSISLPAGKFRIPPAEMQEMLPRQALMLLSAEAALADASMQDREHTHTGVFIGTGLDFNATGFSLRWQLPAMYAEWQQQGIDSLPPLEALQDQLSAPLSANRTMGALGSVVASRIARAFGVGGPSFTLSSEENSGLQALQTAVEALQRDEIDTAIVGAVDMPGDLRAQLSNQRLGRTDFITDGACAMVLKPLSAARRDGNTIYAVVEACATARGDAPDLLTPDQEASRRALARIEGNGRVQADHFRFMELSAYNSGRGETHAIEPVHVSAARAGHAGEASGLMALTHTALALHRRMAPAADNSQHDYWLHNAAAGPRRALVKGCATGGLVNMISLREDDCDKAPLPRRFPLGCSGAVLFRLPGATAADIKKDLEQLRTYVQNNPHLDLGRLAQYCDQRYGKTGAQDGRCFCCVSTTHAELEAQLAFGIEHLKNNSAARLDGRGGARIPACARGKVFYAPEPLARDGKVAFVFPGSGNHFPDMGRDLARTWPAVFERQHCLNQRLRDQYRPDTFWDGMDQAQIEQDHNSMIIAHVAFCTALSDTVRRFGVEPQTAIGYSLGESSSLFSLEIWRERDEMLRRIEASPLFTHDLAGPCDAARKLWELSSDETVDWCLGIVPLPAAQIQAVVERYPRAYLLIVNTPSECVVGGQRAEVKQMLAKLGNPPFVELKGVTTVHCPVPRVVADAYHALHRFETYPVDLDIYSCASGKAYVPTTAACADAILAQAVDTIDFTRAINHAYTAGARIFIETGTGNSCTRMVRNILAERPHMVQPTCVEGETPLTTFAILIGQLEAEGVRCNLEQLRLPDSVTAAMQNRLNTEKTETDSGKNVARKNLVLLINGIDEIRVPLSTGTVRVADTPAARATTASADDKAAAKACPRTQSSRTQSSRTQSSCTPSQSKIPEPAAEHLPQDPFWTGMHNIQERHSAAHGEFLRLSNLMQSMLAENISLQQSLGAVCPVDAQHVDTPWSVSVPPADSATTPAPQMPEPARSHEPPLFDRTQCMEFAVGSIGNMLGEQFAPIDAHPSRVRLPDEPLMLVDRIMLLEGEAGSMGSGRVVTEHDVTRERWYLDGDRIPTCIAVEAGQADLFLSGYLGIDFKTKGKAVYRLLDAVVRFHDALPGPGSVIRYDIRVERFFRQGDTWLFKFNFESTVDGKPLLSMRDGCAGFFTPAQLNDGRGIVHTSLDLRPLPGIRPDDWQPLVPMQQIEDYTAAQINALRNGDLVACFGPEFRRLNVDRPYTLPHGHMELVDRVTRLDPQGGRYGMGKILAEMDIFPDDWFLTCHFCDDHVMPGTLMYECCLHTLRIFLMRMGWVTAMGEGHWEPVPGVDSQLKCRGQVIETTKTVTYEVSLKEIGYRPEPYAIVDALMYADSKPIVEITNMSVQLTGLTRAALQQRWSSGGIQEAQSTSSASPEVKKPALYDYASILAFSSGKPSEAFGEPYRIFDTQRRIARLPRPPFQFLDRITAIDATAWKMVAGGSIEAQYDIPEDAWYFAQERSDNMPFSVLLEIALQPCGWLAAYVGSALTSEIDLCFRNLDGNATKHRPVTRSSGTLTTSVKLTRVSSSGGMIIQSYDFTVADSIGPVYSGDTVFGFFSRDALDNQVGIQGATPYSLSPSELERAVNPGTYPPEAPLPDTQLRMLDSIDVYVHDGGPEGLGYIRGSKIVDPHEWFFDAHFYQDPVCPGSLGLESFIQLIKYMAVQHWGQRPDMEFDATASGLEHSWTYRGQVIPTNNRVSVEAVIRKVDAGNHVITADGYLSVDGKVIYSMKDFTVKINI